MIKVEYVWVDGCEPWGMRSKVKVLSPSDEQMVRLASYDERAIPRWSFDGSSTEQASTESSDCILNPVKLVPDPLGSHDFIVFCEVLLPSGSPHVTNQRTALVTLEDRFSSHGAAFGFEQEFVFMIGDRPLGFPQEGFPKPQGIYYCSAGSDRAFGRGISDTHLQACIDAGLDICGTNAEVMPGQWEYQIGGPLCDAVDASDQLWLSRWLLIKVAEAYDVSVSFDPKPVQGDWNGSGCHANFSTSDMRNEGGIQVIEEACKKLSRHIDRHISAYGQGISKRLTGLHETCPADQFRWGIADRTASIRIPADVKSNGHGYLEDRRPNSNCDPYSVAHALLLTVCGG